MFQWKINSQDIEPLIFSKNTFLWTNHTSNLFMFKKYVEFTQALKIKRSMYYESKCYKITVYLTNKSRKPLRYSSE